LDLAILNRTNNDKQNVHADEMIWIIESEWSQWKITHIYENCVQCLIKMVYVEENGQTSSSFIEVVQHFFTYYIYKGFLSSIFHVTHD